jgi:hypothetical protein
MDVSARMAWRRILLRDSHIPMLTRRDFLKVGALGALVLAAARWGHAQSLLGRADASENGAMLDPGAREVLGAVVPVILAGALPGEESARSRRIASTVEGVDRAVAGLPPHAREDLRGLFTLLGFGPSRWLLAGVRQPWRNAPVAEIAAFLERWRTSSWALKQQAYQAFHELVFAAYYANPESWPDIGYPGPPRLD